MKTGSFSVRNALFMNLLSALILIVGIYYCFTIKQEAFPNISLDMVSVSTSYLGATPQEIEKLITIPIEEKLIEVDDIDEITSVSAENISSILIEIDPDARNKNKVIQDIQRAVDRTNDLPDDLRDDPLVTEIQTKNIPVLQISLTGLPEAELRRQADSLYDKLQDVSGVASVQKSGWHDREIRVEVSPEKVRSLYVSLNEIITALHNKNLNLPGGAFKKGDSEYLVRTMGEFETAPEVEKVIVRANEEGNWITISDVGKVNDTFEDDNIIFKTNGLSSINLIVVKRESANTLKVVEKVRDTIKVFQKTAPQELKISTFDDISYYIKRRLGVLVGNGIMGFILVLACLFFLLDARLAFWTAWSLPASICGSLIIMSALGISVNLVSMFGMIIVIGMLVDDGIIISENCYRYIEQGMPVNDAVIKGTDEVTKSVFATVLTTIASFLPLFFMSGLMGKYTRNIPQVVIIMLAVSLFEAFFCLPAHIAKYVKHKTEKPNRIQQTGDRFMAFLSKHYERIIIFVAEHRYKVLSSLLITCIAAVLIMMFGIKFILFTSEGVEEFFINCEAPVSVSTERTASLIEPVEALLKKLPPSELENYVTTVGQMSEDSHGDSFTTGSHVAQIHVFLTPESKRHRKTAAIMNELRKELKSIPGFEKLTLEELKPGPPVGKPIAVKLRGDHFATLEEISAQFCDYLKTIKGVNDIQDDYNIGKDELRVVIDEQKATQLFLSVRDIASAVRYAFDGGIATTIKTTDEEIDVTVQFKDETHSTFDAFNCIYIPNKFGKLIPLNKVATLKVEKGINAIKHYDRKRVITVSATINEDITTSVAVNNLLQKKFRDIQSLHPDVTITYGGEQEDTKESMQSLMIAFVWGFMIIFLILSSTFQSMVQPFIVLSSIPLAFVGVIFTFFLHGKPFGFFAVMGGVGLAGVAVNDAIVMVDFINRLRADGVSLHDAIIQAGKTRLRPVFLTTVTTVSGLLPTAYGWGGSDPFVKPMALALAWGLVFATLSTLIVIPCIYATLDDIKKRVTRFTKNKVESITQTLHHT